MNPKRKQTEDFILKHITMMEPSGSNTTLYKKHFESMSDKQFDDFMKNLKITLNIPNGKITINIRNLLKTSKSLKMNLFKKIKRYDAITGMYYTFPHKYLILRLPVRRAKQYLQHKLSVAESDKRLDSLTGQVAKPDKSSSISFVEAQLLYARGLDNTLTEYMKVRGGDIHAFSNFKQQLEETGTAKLSNIDPNTIPRSTLVVSRILKCMYIDNNIIEEG